MLNLDQKWMLVGLGGMFYLFAFAPLVLLVLVRRRTKERRWWFDIGLTVAIAWVVNCTYRLLIEVPVNTEYAHARGDFAYDGVGGNAATLFVTGWLLPLIECGIVRLVFLVSSRRKKA